MAARAHLLDARPSVRPRRVAVQVAADVVELHQRRRLAAERLLAQLRRTPGDAERPVDAGLVRRVRQRLERARRTPARPSRGRAPSRSAAARRRRARPPRPRPSPRRRAARSCSTTATIWGSAAKRASVAAGSGAAHDHRELLARVAPAPHVAGRLAVRGRPRCRATSSRARSSRSAAPRARLGLAGERLEQLAPRSSARSPARSAAARRPPPRAAPRACGRPARARSRSSAWHSGRDSGRGRRDRARARARARPARRCRPSRRARAAAPRCPPPIPRSSRTRPLRTSSATGTGAARIVSAARR